MAGFAVVASFRPPTARPPHRDSLTVNGAPVNLAGDAPVDCDTRQWPNSASNRTMGMGTPSIKSRIERIVRLLKTKLKTQLELKSSVTERATAKRLRHDRVAYLR
jgi:hypothetical protein